MEVSVMRHSALKLCAALCLLVGAQAAAAAKDTWTSVRTKNFHLVGNAGEKEIRRVATRLEQFRNVFTLMFPRANFRSPVPTRVVVFKSDNSFKPFKPVHDGKRDDQIAGYFQPGEEVNYIALSTERSGQNPFETIYHEMVHLLVENNFGKWGAPPWFNEGLAEYYSTFDIDDDRKVYIGKLPEGHLYTLRNTQLIPLSTLLSVDHYSLLRNGHQARGMFYAQSWALVHYLVLGNEGRRLPQLAQFLGLLQRNMPPEQAFREAFQTDYAGMERELKDYINRRTFQGKVTTFDEKLAYDSQIEATTLTEAEADSYLGDLLLHMNRLDEAAARLEQALKLDPKLAAAHASLGLVRVRQGRYDAAKRHLREAVVANAENYLAHYYYAYAVSREGMDESGRVMSYPAERAQEMRAALRRAAELNPNFPGSYYLQAWVNLVQGEKLDEAVTLLQQARTLSPGNPTYAFILAQVYLRQEKYDAARLTAEQLMREGDPQMRANAQSLLSALAKMREQRERYEAMREAAERRRQEPDASAPTSGTDRTPPRLVRRGDDLGSDDQTAPRAGRTDDELAADALSAAINDALRKPLEGETRARGVLTRIECQGNSLVFVVKVGERLLRLTSQGFQGLHILAFTPDAGSELTCGARKKESFVVVTYRPSADGRGKSDGALAALEFVPANFQLKQ
jgi:tetratricopeptide (TPR) repeat protein